MDNNAILTKTFSTSLNVEESIIQDSLEFNSISEWDSVSHLALVAALEEVFDIMLDAEDIINMSSVAKTREILRETYSVEF